MSRQPAILFVCTANICRSPMAAALFRERLRRDGREGQYEVRLAGTWASEGQPASENARLVMKERGLNIDDHVAHTVVAADVAGADLILTMERGQREALAAEFPASRGKTYLLSEMVGQCYDLADPYAGPIEGYRRYADELERLLDQGYLRILTLAGPGKGLPPQPSAIDRGRNGRG
jgi:protein-tyrosine-phosphatase